MAFKWIMERAQVEAGVARVRAGSKVDPFPCAHFTLCKTALFLHWPTPAFQSNCGAGLPATQVLVAIALIPSTHLTHKLNDRCGRSTPTAIH
jgi:hypothetical protein